MSIAQIPGRFDRSPATIKGYFYDPSQANKRRQVLMTGAWLSLGRAVARGSSSLGRSRAVSRLVRPRLAVRLVKAREQAAVEKDKRREPGCPYRAPAARSAPAVSANIASSNGIRIALEPGR